MTDVKELNEVAATSADDALTPVAVDNGEKQTLPLVAVRIERGRDVVTVDVPEHEVRILQIVHGEHNVQVDEDADEDEGEFTTNADIEFRRLQGKYRRMNAPDPVLLAYPNGSGQLDGFTKGRGKLAQAPQSVSINHRKESVKAKKAAEAKAGKGKK